MIQHLACQVIGDKQEGFKRSKTILWSSVQVKKSKKANLGSLGSLKINRMIFLDPTTNDRSTLPSMVGNGFEDESFQMRGKWCDPKNARNCRAIAKSEEHQGNIAGFEKMIPDLAWQVIGDQEEDFKRSETVNPTIDGRVLAKEGLEVLDLPHTVEGLFVYSYLSLIIPAIVCLCSSNFPKQSSRESSRREVHLGSEWPSRKVKEGHTTL
ncbi:hypothetical protein M9H77_07586 [Catharanthus roseus]|uniref:Uncharacterized protein n=1 Tax=Catharanthus roseus TaxID=4058 RepID=A0ACC0BVD6_CATRO|nr:hypothetical protein M9H77_07586 [Catharanthus roseus]